MRFDVSIPIRRSQPDVFAFLADVQRHAKSPGSPVLEMEKTPPGPTEVGTRWREVIRIVPGLTMTVHSEVVVFDRNHRLQLRFRGPGMTGSLDYTLRWEGATTLLRQQEALELDWWLLPFRTALERRLRSRLHAIRSLLEWKPETPPRGVLRVNASVRIEASPDIVAATLNSARDAPSWQEGLQRMEVVRGAPNTIGSRARLHYVEQGRSHVMEDELIDCEPNRRWRSRVAGNGMTAIVQTCLSEADGATIVELTWDGRPDRWLARRVLPLMRRTLRRRIEEDLAALRRFVERSTAGPSDAL